MMNGSADEHSKNADQETEELTPMLPPFSSQEGASLSTQQENMPVPGEDWNAQSPDTDELRPRNSAAVETAVLEPLPETENPLLQLSRQAKASKAGEQSMIVGKRCAVGAVRDRNEDACLVFTSESGGHFPLLPFGLYIVADGMGGHKNGHIASKTASRIAARHLIDRIYLPMLQIEGGLGMQRPIQEVMEEAVAAAHRVLYDPKEESDSGTTLTIGLVLGSRLYVSHVGDTRLYIWHNDKLEKVTTDHSLVQRLQDVGQLTAEEASYYQYRHVLLRAVGQGEELSIDTYTRRLPAKGKLLLCTDGVSGLIPEYEIAMIMRQDKSPDAIAADLLNAAMDAGGYDNITAIVVDFQLG